MAFTATRAAPGAQARLEAQMQMLKPAASAMPRPALGCYAGDAATVIDADGVTQPGHWLAEPCAVRSEMAGIMRAIDDDNYAGGTTRERTLGYLEAHCAPRWLEVTGSKGGAWRLPAECTFEDYKARLRMAKADKAVSLDQHSKEMVEAAPEDVQRAFYEAHMRIATPTPDGTRHKPEGWSIIPVTLIDKKEESDVVRERRNIAKI